MRDEAGTLRGSPGTMKLWWLDALDADGDADGDDDMVCRVDGGAPTALAPTAMAPVFDEARALIAMACVDGAPNDRERACVFRFVAVDDSVAWRVYRPREAGMPAGSLAARRVLQHMAEIATCDRADGVLDDSERLLLFTYARAYGISDDDVARLLAEFVERRGGAVARLLAALSAAWPAAWSVLRRRRSSSSASASSSFASVVVRPREVR